MSSSTPSNETKLSPQEQLNKALFMAVGAGNLDMVRSLCEKGADANYTEGKHNCLQLATIRCYLHIVRYLHEEQNVSIRDDPRVVHMLALGKVKHPQLLAYLKAQGADINRCDDTIGTPLMLALYKEDADEQFARWLIGEGVDVSVHQPGGERSSALHKAARNCSVDLVRLLLEKGATSLLDARDASNMTPLMHAVNDGNEETVDLLVNEYNVDADQLTAYTPLFLAVQNGHYGVAKILVEAGADVNFRDAELQCYPLHLAASNSHLAIMRLLLENGADANVVEKRGYTPLMMAASEGYTDAVQLLLKHGAKPEMQASADGRTALHHAIFAQKARVLPPLLRAGPQCLEIQDGGGLTPPVLAEQMESVAMHNALKNWESLDKPQSVCGNCWKLLETPKRCSRCKAIWYCCAQCQKENWKEHKAICAKAL